MKIRKSLFIIILYLVASLFLISNSFGVEQISSCPKEIGDSQDNYYNVTSDIVGGGACFEILRNDFKLNCNGYKINSSVPIYIFNQVNISIMNCDLISDSDNSMDLGQTKDSYFENISIYSNDVGINLGQSSNNEFKCVNIMQSTTGINLINSNNNTFSCLDIKNSNSSISINKSSSNTFEGIIRDSNEYGVSFSTSSNDSNTFGNIFELELQNNVSLTDDITIFSNRFNNNENNISNSYRSKFTTFNVTDVSKNHLSDVAINISANRFSFNSLIDSIKNSSIIVSYFEFVSGVNIDEVEEKSISNYNFSVSKANFSTINQTLPYQEEYNFTLYSTQNLNISLLNYTSTMFDNESKIVSFTIQDTNNYSVENVSVEINSTLQNITSNSSNNQYSFAINATALPLGITPFTIYATNEFNITTQLSQNINVISSLAPKLELNLSQNYTLTNKSIQINLSINTNKSYNYTLSTQLNETILSNSSNSSLNLILNYTPSTLEDINFTLFVIDEDGLNSTISKPLSVYLNENFTFNISGKENITNNSITTLEIVNSTQQNNVTNWYEFYSNSTLIKNSTIPQVKINLSNYSQYYYTTFDNTTNTSSTYLDVEVFIKNSIGVNSNQTHTFTILNASNVTANIDFNPQIHKNSNLKVEVINYNSSLNYSFEDVTVIINSNNTQEFNTTVFEISNLSLGTHRLDFAICNLYDECIFIENESVSVIKKPTKPSGGGGSSGGGGGRSSSSSRNDDSPFSSSYSSDVTIINLSQNENETSQLSSEKNTSNNNEEVNENSSDDRIYQVEFATLRDDKNTELNNSLTGYITGNLPSLIGFIIGLLLIIGIIFFLAKRKNKSI